MSNRHFVHLASFNDKKEYNLERTTKIQVEENQKCYRLTEPEKPGERGKIQTERERNVLERQKKNRKAETVRHPFFVQIIPIMDEMECKSPKFHKLLIKILCKTIKTI